MCLRERGRYRQCPLERKIWIHIKRARYEIMSVNQLEKKITTERVF